MVFLFNRLKWVPGSLFLSLLGACAPVVMPDSAPWHSAEVRNVLTTNLDGECVANYQPGRDYFPDKAQFVASSQLTVSYHGNYKRVTFRPAVDTRETLRLVLVQCGTPAPRLRAGETLVEVPIRSLATANISLLGAAVLLGVGDRVKGIPTTRTSLPQIAQQLAAKTTSQVYPAGHGNGEQAASIKADIFFTFYSAFPSSNIHPLLRQLGVVSAPQSDHTEATPLGRAEWIKYVALFVNREERANTIFADRQARYAELAARVKGVTLRPLVQTGFPNSRDEWSQGGGQNSIYRLIEDAGGRHAWSDVRSSGSLTYAPMERLYDRAADADVWIGNSGPGSVSMAALRRERPQMTWLKPIRTNRVWWFDVGRTGTAGAAWPDQGMTEPQDALADMIAVLHPELIRRPQLRFLRRIPGGSA